MLLACLFDCQFNVYLSVLVLDDRNCYLHPDGSQMCDTSAGEVPKHMTSLTRLIECPSKLGCNSVTECIAMLLVWDDVFEVTAIGSDPLPSNDVNG